MAPHLIACSSLAHMQIRQIQAPRQVLGGGVTCCGTKLPPRVPSTEAIFPMVCTSPCFPLSCAAFLTTLVSGRSWGRKACSPRLRQVPLKKRQGHGILSVLYWWNFFPNNQWPVRKTMGHYTTMLDQDGCRAADDLPSAIVLHVPLCLQKLICQHGHGIRGLLLLLLLAQKDSC